MSKKQSNRQRAADLCHKATDVGHQQCMNWADQGKVSRRQPVPDAATPNQRRFEALLAHHLTEPLRDSQLDGAVLGLRGVVPDAVRPTLHLHPVMASWIVAELLPCFDVSFGGIRGVPGLRLAHSDGQWMLVDVSSTAAVRLKHDDPDWRPTLRERQRGMTSIWRDAPTRLSRVERQEIAYWESEKVSVAYPKARDLLFSRVLRRPLLINAAASSHGWANTYNHHTEDIVVEWCCGTPATEIAADLRRSGITATAEGVDARPTYSRDPHPERIDIGDASLVLRCLNATWCRRGAERIAAANRRKYR
ncbi:hypothetical protein [Streptomyces sp. Je 1-369]|uniref:hypothetical protein n=1 Tax=Streptomyces sp. Je 1-369 TaxID=2966192 RepID=UPI0022867917|nr:hypothetical protein [Streptomyces sp. Je 1-369]WAL98045.1 hypothetical protein NOO62_28305 [Streptomyces sp. Je 1-369]